MNNDKIIRAISDIDDRYILEAAPDQPAMANRRRFLAGRVIGITAIAAAAVIGLLIGGITLLRPSGSKSAMTAADYDIVSQAGKDTGASITDSVTIKAEAEVAEEEDQVYETAAASANEEKALTEDMSVNRNSAVLAKGPEEKLLLLVSADSADIEIEEASASFTLLLSEEGRALYLLTPASDSNSDLYGTIHIKGGREALQIQKESGDSHEVLTEMPEEMQKLYEKAMEK